MLPSKKSNDIVLYIVYNLWKFVNCCSKIIICWHLQIHSCIKSSTRAAERGKQRGKFVLGPHFLEAFQKFCWEVKHNNYYTVKGYTCTCPHLSTCLQASGFLSDFNPFPPRLSKTTSLVILLLYIIMPVDFTRQGRASRRERVLKGLWLFILNLWMSIAHVTVQMIIYIFLLLVH